MKTLKLSVHGGGKTVYAKIDANEAWALKHRWHLSKDGFVVRSRTKMPLHRAILGSPPCRVYHINKNKLDCRKDNLICL